MKNKYFFLFAISLIAFILPNSCSKHNSPFPKNAKKIVFLGNSITYSGQYIEDIEAYFVNHYPDYQYEFINLGLPSETVSGLSEEGHANGEFPRPCLDSRIDSLLSKVQPDVAFVCYGMNDGIYLPYDEERFGKYSDGIERLYNRLESAGTKKIYLMTPPTHDDSERGLEGYNLTLDKYSEWLVEEGKRKKWDVIDLHFSMNEFLLEKRKNDPTFKLANDGIHPAELGHWLMAREILAHLGENVIDKESVRATFDGIVNADRIYQQVKKRQRYMKDAWLSYVGHDRPGMNKGMSMNEFQRLNKDVEKEINALKKGDKRIVVSCIGNSITQGVGVKHDVLDSYPAQLQRMLGNDKYEVLNFGVSATTLLSSTNKPYIGTHRYQNFLKSDPDIVTIKLGTNDSRLPYRTQIADSLIIQAKRLIATIKNLPTKPRIILLLPASSYLTNETQQTDVEITNQVIPRIQQIAYDEGLELLDTHSATADRNEIFPDNLHPNEDGMEIIAKSIYENLISPKDESFDITKGIEKEYTSSSFYGYQCIDFDFNGRNAKIAIPKRTDANHPWIWRARFWGHEPQTDIAMLDRGYHIVYIDTSKLFGNSESVQLWNDFYSYMQKLGLYKKAALEAMSRGGVYAYNWAAENPDKVLSVYADAPVLDLKSWPGGKGKGKKNLEDWNDFLKAYDYKSEKDAESFNNSPLNKVEEIVKGGYPMLHIVGDKDDLVPVEENTTLFEERVKGLNGNIIVVHKPEVGHHPHSLKNPQVIVDFIEKSLNDDLNKK